MRQRSLTILELMVVFVLLAVAATVGISKGRHFLQKEAFYQKGQHLVHATEMARELAADYRSDVTLLLEKSGSKLTCSLYTTSPLPEPTRKALESHLPLFKQVNTLYWNGLPQEKVALLFEGQTFQPPEGTIQIQGEQDIEVTIQLPKKGPLQEAPYPEEIRSAA